MRLITACFKGEPGDSIALGFSAKGYDVLVAV
jgi:hypothetical protein